jgi:hypothetical protein
MLQQRMNGIAMRACVRFLTLFSDPGDAVFS